MNFDRSEESSFRIVSRLSRRKKLKFPFVEFLFVCSKENDFHNLRDEQIRQLMLKDFEFEQNQIELESLNEKLHALAEYDRNLKFELTLYRGVLESEHRLGDNLSFSSIKSLVEEETKETLTNVQNENFNELELVLEGRNKAKRKFDRKISFFFEFFQIFFSFFEICRTTKILFKLTKISRRN